MTAIEINEHLYEVDGPTVIAERYRDGVELHIYCTSDLGTPTSATLVHRDSRGKKHIRALSGLTASDATEISLRLMDARHHIRMIDQFRHKKWSQ